MSSPRLNLVLGGETISEGADPSAAMPSTDGSIHLHIHLDREGRDEIVRDAGEGRPVKGYARPVLVSLGAVALAVASFYAGQHTHAAPVEVAAATAPAARLPFRSAAPVLPGTAAGALPPALRAQLATPPTVIPPPAAPTTATPAPGTPVGAPAAPPRSRNPFGLGE